MIGAVAPVGQHFHQHVVVVAGDADADGGQGGVALGVLVHDFEYGIGAGFSHVGDAVGQQRQSRLASPVHFCRGQLVGQGQPGLGVGAAARTQLPCRAGDVSCVIAVGEIAGHAHLVGVGHDGGPVAGDHLLGDAVDYLFRQAQAVVGLHGAGHVHHEHQGYRIPVVGGRGVAHADAHQHVSLIFRGIRAKGSRPGVQVQPQRGIGGRIALGQAVDVFLDPHRVGVNQIPVAQVLFQNFV